MSVNNKQPEWTYTVEVFGPTDDRVLDWDHSDVETLEAERDIWKQLRDNAAHEAVNFSEGPQYRATAFRNMEECSAHYVRLRARVATIHHNQTD